MPKPSKPTSREHGYLPPNTFVLDNGAFSIKAGFAPIEPLPDAEALKQCRDIPNSLVRTRDKRTYIASQQHTILQWSEAIFRRPIERGQLVSWEAEKAIWDYSFFDEKTADKDVLITEPGDTTLVLTETPNAMMALQRNADEIIMEEWGFGGYARVVGPSLNAYNDLNPVFGDIDPVADPQRPPLARECLLVIDSGYSHTTITPLYQGTPIQRAIRRLDFGGKHLTNLLKEVISVRYFDLHQDAKIVNDIKEDVCFVSSDFDIDMGKVWKGNLKRRRKAGATIPSNQPLVVANSGEVTDADAPSRPPVSSGYSEPSLLVDYILPDGFRIHRGFSRPHDPTTHTRREPDGLRSSTALATEDNEDEVSMTLGPERISIPEILFTPTYISSRQPGIPDTVMQSLAVLPPALQATFLANILVVGGNAKIRGFVSRIQDELRMRAPVEYEVRVRAMEDPVTSTWLGGARMAGNREIVRSIGVNREEYAEHGSGWAGRRFAGRSG